MSARGKEIYIIAGVIAVVLIVAWYFLLFSPTKQKLSDLDDQIAADESALATAQQDAGSSAVVREDRAAG